MITTLSLDPRSSKFNARNYTRFQFLRLLIPGPKTHDIVTYLSLVSRKINSGSLKIIFIRGNSGAGGSGGGDCGGGGDRGGGGSCGGGGAVVGFVVVAGGDGGGSGSGGGGGDGGERW